MRRARWKRKSVCSKLAHRCKFGGNGFCENCCAGEELRTKSRAGCRACPALYAVLIVASNLRVQRGHPLPPFPLPLPLSLEGFPKGRNRSFAPLSRFKGVRGEIEIPPRFSLGGRGDILFSKENIPLASPYRAGTFHREFPLWEQETHTGSPYSTQVLLSVTFTSIKLPIRLLSPFSRTSRLPSVREARGKFSSSLSPSTSTRTVLPT